MRTWIVTEADRTPEGKIRTLADLLPKLEEEETQRRPHRPLGKLEAAGAVCGLLLAVAAIAALNAFAPVAPRLPSPTAAPAPTLTMVSTPTRTSTPTPTPSPTPEPPTATQEPPPTAEVVYVPVEPPCDPMVNPRYVVELDLSPFGRARGVSCNSQEEAAANAEAQAAQVRAAFEPTATVVR